MTGNELRQAIADLRISQADFARLVGVTVGAVSQWLSEARTIPGPVEAFVGLFSRLPPSIREFELMNLQKGNFTMKNGMYLIHFSGSNGDGYATLTFQDGLVFGFDTAGCQYDGVARPNPLGRDQVDVQLKVRMPPNVASVAGGIAQPFEWVLSVSTSIDGAAVAGKTEVNTGIGLTIQANYQRMRDLPTAIAA